MTLEECIQTLPLELRERIYKHFVKIQVKRKEELHPPWHKAFNHWYLNSIKCLITLKAYQISDLERRGLCWRIPLNTKWTMFHIGVRRYISWEEFNDKDIFLLLLDYQHFVRTSIPSELSASRRLDCDVMFTDIPEYGQPPEGVLQVCYYYMTIRTTSCQNFCSQSFAKLIGRTSMLV